MTLGRAQLDAYVHRVDTVQINIHFAHLAFVVHVRSTASICTCVCSCPKPGAAEQ